MSEYWNRFPRIEQRTRSSTRHFRYSGSSDDETSKVGHGARWVARRSGACGSPLEHLADIPEAHSFVAEVEGSVISHFLGGAKKGAKRDSREHAADADAFHS